jgi:hypothetical protein
MITLLLATATGLSACGDPALTPTEKLAEKFGQNFDPNTITYFADRAYHISEARDKDPNSTITCAGQDEPTMDKNQLIQYLIDCNSRQRILELFKKMELNQSGTGVAKPKTHEERDAKSAELQSKRSIKVDDIALDDDIYKIYALLGKDPELYTSFMKTIVTYRGWDMDEQDTFRHPIETMRSGWTDCDDWAVEHYLWAHLHHYSPNLVIAVKDESTGQKTGNEIKVNAHTFVTYNDPGISKTVVLDNQSWSTLEPGQTVESYVQANYPNEGLTVEFDGPYISQ